MDWIAALRQAVCNGDEIEAEALTKQALGEGTTPGVLLTEGAVAGVTEAGRLWQAGEYFIPEVILATEAFKVVMTHLEPLLSGEDAQSKGRVIIGSMAGDAHHIGKDIVAAMLRSAAFEVVDLGVDVSVETFLAETRSRKPDILGLGAYMTTTMRGMENVIRALKEAGLRDQVKVIVGGVALNSEYAARIGADGYGADAVAAVSLVKNLLGVR